MRRLVSPDVFIVLFDVVLDAISVSFRFFRSIRGVPPRIDQMLTVFHDNREAAYPRLLAFAATNSLLSRWSSGHTFDEKLRGSNLRK